MMPLQNLI
jgi:predicted nucleic-acid-binding Zn-ribbon protein